MDVQEFVEIGGVILSKCEQSLLPKTRIHKLRLQPFPGATLWVKREDEAGFAVAGGKLRKYASLLPSLRKRGVKEVAVIGNEAGNNVVGMAQFLREWGIKPRFYLKKSHAEFNGNRLLLNIFSEANYLYFPDPKTEWPHIEEICQNWVKQNPAERAWLPEGSAVREALPGAASLYLDILRNEKEADIEFEHIFLDAGTGFTAGANILLHATAPKSLFHCILLAGKEGEFEHQFSLLSKFWKQEFKLPATTPKEFRKYWPKEARSFGSTHSAIWKEITHTARNEGILLDPIYSAKLFRNAKSIIDQQNLTGNILLVHSGGGISLFGYAKKLETYL